MPTYEYVCDGCGHAFEQMQSFKDDPLKMCPKCQEEKLRRLLGTGAAILFKGSGFYETDYRSAAYKSAAKAESEAQKGTNDSSSSGNTSNTSNSGSASSSSTTNTASSGSSSSNSNSKSDGKS